MDHLDKVYEAILDGDMQAAEESVQAALNEDIPPADILQKGMISAMQEVGSLFEEGECFVPEMLIAARAMKAGLEILKPLLIDFGVEPVGKVVLGTVQGDMHDIGKNLVSMMLEGAGFEIEDLGTDVAPEKFVEAAGNDDVDIIGLSALLTTTIKSMERTIKAIEEAGLRDNVKVMVGGAPVTEAYANHIGADGFAEDASQAVAVANGLLA